MKSSEEFRAAVYAKRDRQLALRRVRRQRMVTAAAALVVCIAAGSVWQIWLPPASTGGEHAGTTTASRQETVPNPGDDVVKESAGHTPPDGHVPESTGTIPQQVEIIRYLPEGETGATIADTAALAALSQAIAALEPTDAVPSGGTPAASGRVYKLELAYPGREEPMRILLDFEGKRYCMNDGGWQSMRDTGGLEQMLEVLAVG